MGSRSTGKLSESERPAGVKRRSPTSATVSASLRKPRSAWARPKEHDRYLEIPRLQDSLALTLNGQGVHLSNLRKMFWPALGITKRDLLQYYVEVSPALLPHLRHRAMVMKRYPNGVGRAFFFYEARSFASAASYRDLPHHSRFGKRHRLSCSRRFAITPVGGEPGMHRSEPLVCTMR